MYDHSSPPPSYPLYPPSLPSPLVFPRKFLLRSSFAFATDVPFTDLFLIYNIHSPVVSFRSLSLSCITSQLLFAPLTISPSLVSATIVPSVSTVASALMFLLLVRSLISPFFVHPMSTTQFYYSCRNPRETLGLGKFLRSEWKESRRPNSQRFSNPSFPTMKISDLKFKIYTSETNYRQAMGN